MKLLIVDDEVSPASFIKKGLETGSFTTDITFGRDIRIKQPLNFPTLNIQIDRTRAAQSGLTADDISKSLVAATSSSRFTAGNL